MFRFHSSILFLFVLTFTINQSAGTINELIEASVNQLFALWTMPCSKWMDVFSSDAVWYHPKFPDGLSHDKLFDFCQTNQLTKPALFRQDGSIRLTSSGKNESSYFYHVMVPYVYGQIQNGNNDSLFINSGYEYIQLATTRQNDVFITMVVEFFNRDSTPFVWPPNN